MACATQAHLLVIRLYLRHSQRMDHQPLVLQIRQQGMQKGRGIAQVPGTFEQGATMKDGAELRL